MEIKQYEDWMRPQVVALFALEYGVSADEFDELFRKFYESPFQLQKGIRITAVEGDKVGGFQSFFYWPVERHGNKMYTLQSGNSLVHPDFRGQGLFAKMLDYIHQPESGIHFDFLIGFPVEASYNSFIRKKWLNPFNLDWYVLPMHPILSQFGNAESSLSRAFGERKPTDLSFPGKATGIAQEAAFDQYRFAYQKDPLYRFSFQNEEGQALFEMKLQRRKKIIRELVIGKFVSTSESETFVMAAMQALIKAVKKNAYVTMLSIAINPNVEVLYNVVNKCRFRAINKHIYFIAKGDQITEAMDWDKWWVFRGDIDTW